MELDPVDFITQRLLERYGHPSRLAYLYMFRLLPKTDLAPLIPSQADLISGAWVDQGDGLQQTDPDLAIELCKTALNTKIATPSNSHERRHQMARVVTFYPEILSPTEIKIELFSRALMFTPKGDRRVTELWHPVEGGWYSAPVGRE